MITTYWRQVGNEPWTPITRDHYHRVINDAGQRPAGYHYINGIAYRLEHTHGQELRPGRERRGPR